MTTLKELAAMLDAATRPSRELDARLWWAFADHSEDDHDLDGEPLWVMEKLWGGSPSSWTWILQVTSSIDYALSLVERLGFYMISLEWDRLGVVAHLGHRDEALRSWKRVAPTAPLAILRALVAALIAQEKTDEA